VQRVWRGAGLKPNRLERYMASGDPEFESKAGDILGLYLNPPRHAAVFVSTRRPPFKRWISSTQCCRSRRAALSPGFEYYRHGTLSLYAALDTASGREHGKTAAGHTSRDLVNFLIEVVSGSRSVFTLL
jgi:hypothetical protein